VLYGTPAFGALFNKEGTARTTTHLREREREAERGERKRERGGKRVLE
jgi:hypothetical protein